MEYLGTLAKNSKKNFACIFSLAKYQALTQAIITGGTMTLLLLAASLVTTTFLMSPVIEKFLGCKMLLKFFFSTLLFRRGRPQ